MLDVEVLVEGVTGARLSEKASENGPSNYALNVSLSERERNPSSLMIAFTLELTNQPELARINVSGIATLRGSKDEVQGAITAPDDKSPPMILVTIYERIYGLVYIIASNLKVPHPLPSLLKTLSEKK